MSIKKTHSNPNQPSGRDKHKAKYSLPTQAQIDRYNDERTPGWREVSANLVAQGTFSAPPTPNKNVSTDTPFEPPAPKP